MALNLLLFVAILLAESNARDFHCPDDEQMQPCTCETWQKGLGISCYHAEVDQVQEVLSNVAKTNQFIALTIYGVNMVHLSSTFLAGLDFDDLSLNACNLSSLDENAFHGVADNLRILKIFDNDFESVPSHALRSLSSLEYLSLSYNKIEALHAEAFKGLRSLVILTMIFNRMTYIDDSAFMGVEKTLKKLTLDDNELTAIPTKAFRKFESLRQLELRNNKIITLQPEAFASTTVGMSLTSLYLLGNGIRHLPARAFMSLKNLYALDLSKNDMESIDPFAFQGLEDSLGELTLWRNQLVDIPVASLKYLKRLDYVNFNDNNISTIRKDDFKFYGNTLEYIEMQNNSLTFVEAGSFAPLNSLVDLSLGKNRLTSLPLDTYLPVLDTLESLSVYGNPLHCDCEIFWIIDWMASAPKRFSYLKNTKCASPEEYVNKTLKDLSKDQLVCRNTTPKPVQTTQTSPTSETQTTVSLPYHNFSSPNSSNPVPYGNTFIEILYTFLAAAIGISYLLWHFIVV